MKYPNFRVAVLVFILERSKSEKWVLVMDKETIKVLVHGGRPNLMVELSNEIIKMIF